MLLHLHLLLLLRLLPGQNLVAFAFTRPLACSGTENNANFVSAFKETLKAIKKNAEAGSITQELKYKLIDLTTCPNSEIRFSELSDASKSTLTVPLKNASHTC